MCAHGFLLSTARRLPVFVPIIQKVYDGLIVNIIVNCCRKKFSLKNFVNASIVLLLNLPKIAARLVGVGGGSLDIGAFGARIGKLGAFVKKATADRGKHKKASKDRADELERMKEQKRTRRELRARHAVSSSTEARRSIAPRRSCVAEHSSSALPASRKCSVGRTRSRACTLRRVPR